MPDEFKRRSAEAPGRAGSGPAGTRKIPANDCYLAWKIRRVGRRVVETSGGRDRYGDPIMPVFLTATRLGRRCILVYHAPNGDLMVQGNVPVEETIEAAIAAHAQAAGDDYRVRFEDPSVLPDRTRAIGNWLDAHYEKPKHGLPATRPGQVLRLITTHREAEDRARWSFFEDTLHLPVSHRRTGYLSSGPVHDRSLESLFRSLGFFVRTVRLSHRTRPLTLQSRIRLEAEYEQVLKLESKLLAQEQQLTKLRSRQEELELSIQALRRALPLRKAAYQAFLAKHGVYLQ